MLKVIPKVNAKKTHGVTQYTLHYEVTFLWLFTYNTPEIAFYGCEISEKPL
jgi:hypothetical protein